MLIALRDSYPNAQTKKHELFARLKELQIQFMTPETSSFLTMKDELKKYNDCAIMELYLERPTSLPRRIVSGTFNFYDPANNKLFNQIIARKIDPASSRYYLGFTKTRTLMTTGLDLGRFNIEGEWFKPQPNSASDMVVFPGESPFIRAFYDRSGIIYWVEIKLTSTF